MKKEFKTGDLVHIKKELPSYMSHFTCDKDAIVTKYLHNSCQSGSDWEHLYSLFIKGYGETSWYHNSNLTLIKHDQMQLLKRWKKEEEEEEKLKSDLDWIFSNGKKVLKSAHSATVSALAKGISCSNLWGSRGESFTYYQNAITVLAMAGPFLRVGDKAGWLNFCKEYKDRVSCAHKSLGEQEEENLKKEDNINLGKD